MGLKDGYGRPIAIMVMAIIIDQHDTEST
jgi:hypothetical protein